MYATTCGGRQQMILVRAVVFKDERMLAYYIGGTLNTVEREKKYRGLTSMIRYLSRPFLFPLWKFLRLQGSRELSLLASQKNPMYSAKSFFCSADTVVVGPRDQIFVWSVSAQKEL